MNYISLEAIKFLFNLLSCSTKKGRREMALLVLLYDSGARVQKIADLTFGDVRNIMPTTLKLHGKGGISYILNKYVTKAKKLSPELFSEKISPHTLRHSKAVHLLEGGVNLIYIRDFLGHSTIVTTELCKSISRN